MVDGGPEPGVERREGLQPPDAVEWITAVCRRHLVIPPPAVEV